MESRCDILLALPGLLSVKPTKHVFELQLLEQLIGFRGIISLGPGLLIVQLQVTVRPDGGQLLAQIGQFPVLGQRFPDALFAHLLQMRIKIVNGTELGHQGNGCLFSHLGHPGNIVGGISHQRLQFNKLLRRHLVQGFHILRVIVLNLRPPHPGLGNPDFDTLRGNLQQIPVPGYQGHLHPPSLRLFGQSPQNIVRLQARLFHNGDFHGLKHFLHHRYLLPQFLRHGLAGALVRLIHLMAEGGRMHVKGHRQIIRMFLLQDLEHYIQKAKDRVGMQPFCVAQIRHAVKGSVQYAVSVN